MARTIRQLGGVNTLRNQHFRWQERQRTQAQRDITKGLFRTHIFGPTAVNFDTATVFPATPPPDDLARPFTCVCDIEVTGAAAAGVIIEIGDTSAGCGLLMSAGSLFGFGGGLLASDGVDVSVALGIGRRVQAAVAMIPGDGRLVLYLDGKAISRGVASGGAFLNSRIAAASGGGVAQVNGTLSARMPAVTTPTNFQLVSPVSIYVGQLPRNFV